MSAPSALEALLLSHIRAVGLAEPVTELRFAPPRRWRFDLAWPLARVAAECEGGTWTRGRHTSGAGFAADCEKYNSAALLGWRVLRFTRAMIEEGDAIDALAWALGATGGHDSADH